MPSKKPALKGVTPLHPAERVRQRMQHWMDTTGLDQRAFSEELGRSQVWLQKVLKGENHVRLKDLDEIARAMRTSAAELVREDHERYSLECTPTEVRILERLRHQPAIYEALTLLLSLKGKPDPTLRAVPLPDKKGS